jgi:4-hydroxyphenylpyruvate dioxygenase
MRWALNQISIAGGSRRPPADLPRDLRALRAGGWRAVEVWLAHGDGYAAAHGLAPARRLLDESGLVAAGACGGAPFFFAEGAALRQALDELRRRLEMCQALGVPHLVVAPGFTEPAAPSVAALDRTAENVRAAGEAAAAYGVRLGIECLAAARLIRSLPVALDLARCAALPNVGVVVDTYHLYAGVSKTEDLDALRDDPWRLFFVHISDVAASKPRELWTVPDRVLPGGADGGGVPNARLLAAVQALGFDGDVSLELFDTGFEAAWAADPVAAAREAYARCAALLPDA